MTIWYNDIYSQSRSHWSTSGLQVAGASAAVSSVTKELHWVAVKLSKCIPHHSSYQNFYSSQKCSPKCPLSIQRSEILPGSSDAAVCQGQTLSTVGGGNDFRWTSWKAVEADHGPACGHTGNCQQQEFSMLRPSRSSSSYISRPSPCVRLTASVQVAQGLLPFREWMLNDSCKHL